MSRRDPDPRRRVVPLAAQPFGELSYALTNDGRIVSFSSSAPGTLLSDVAVSGLPVGEALWGLDFRPPPGSSWP